MSSDSILDTRSDNSRPQQKESTSKSNDSRSPAVEIQGLRKVYRQIIAVDDISLVTYRGEAFGFHGRLNGLRSTFLEKRIMEVLEMVGLAGRENQKLGTFSIGMLQRIGLAQAIIHKPDLVILDELVSGLDPVGQRDMRELLRELKAEGTSIFLNSHLLADVEAICDRVAIINQGRILKVGAPAELFDKKKVLEVRVDHVSEELLKRLHAVALDIQHEEDDPRCLLIEIARDEQAADIADIVNACGARLYTLAPRHLSLEQIFFQTIDALHQEN